jgi:hypothetical protein
MKDEAIERKPKPAKIDAFLHQPFLVHLTMLGDRDTKSAKSILAI